MTIKNRYAYEVGLLLDEEECPGSVGRRHARCGEPHVADLNAWAGDIAQSQAEHVPAFDPECGGNAARVLLLLQDPSKVAAYWSKMISRHNNDRTAANTYWACEQAGLGYEVAVHWNVIPWWAQDPSRPGPEGKPRTLKSQAGRAGPYLAELLDLLPAVSKVVLLGNEARDAWAAATMAPGSRLRPVHVKCCPHPSPRAFNRPENKARVLETLRWAAHDQ